MKTEEEIKEAIDVISAICVALVGRDDRQQFDRVAMARASLEWVISGDNRACDVIDRTIALGRTIMNRMCTENN